MILKLKILTIELVALTSISLSDFLIKQSLTNEGNTFPNNLFTLWGYNSSEHFREAPSKIEGRNSGHCYVSGSMGLCMRIADCVASQGRALGPCPKSEGENLFCCRLYDIYDDSGMNYECGTTSKQFSRRGKVVNGTVARYAEFPWQVYITSTTLRRSACGGTLLSEKWVITAAHCVYVYKARNLLAILGKFDFSTEDEPFNHAERRISRKIMHDHFNYKGENDIALLQLKNKVQLQPNIVPICLPEQGANFANMVGIVTGWGKTAWDAPHSLMLRKVSLPILTNEECKASVPNYHDSFICAGFFTGEADSCNGDSGGPLQVKRMDNRFYLVGIVSSGVSMCAQKNTIGVYTKVPLFVQWIRKWTDIPT